MTPRKPTRAKQLGVSDEEYARLLAAQGGHCALCPNTPKTEHDPKRSWRCRYCALRNEPGTSECEACSRARPKPPGLHVDHDHATGKVRGLLCYVCNRSLPASRGAEWHRAAADYLDPDEAPSMTAAQAWEILKRLPVVNVEATSDSVSAWRAATEKAKQEHFS